MLLALTQLHLADAPLPVTNHASAWRRADGDFVPARFALQFSRNTYASSRLRHVERCSEQEIYGVRRVGSRARKNFSHE